jgi:hypothetical protein
MAHPKQGILFKTDTYFSTDTYRALRPQTTMAIEKVKTVNKPAQPNDRISIVAF